MKKNVKVVIFIIVPIILVLILGIMFVCKRSVEFDDYVSGIDLSNKRTNEEIQKEYFDAMNNTKSSDELILLDWSIICEYKDNNSSEDAFQNFVMDTVVESTEYVVYEENRFLPVGDDIEDIAKFSFSDSSSSKMLNVYAALSDGKAYIYIYN